MDKEKVSSSILHDDFVFASSSNSSSFFLNKLLLEEVVAPALLVVAVKAPFPQDEAEAPTQLISSAAQRRRSWCLRHRCR